MRRVHVLIVLSVVALLILGACNMGKLSSTETESPVAPSQPPAETEPPTLTESPVEATASPTIIPVDPGIPPMEVGSKFVHVDGSVLVAVPAGPFTMGYGGEENPQHTVNLSDFWIYRAKVTNAQYALCLKMKRCSFLEPEDNPGFTDPLQANHPVVGVRYDQAVDYCTFVHGRLPTEAEWEKTARGPDGNIYPWGNETPSCDLANIANCVRMMTSVKDYPQGQSFYEALDMTGNAYEWVADWYNPYYYARSPVDDPTGPEQGNLRSVRSSSFDSPTYEVESARRFYNDPHEPRSNLGFRCVVTEPTYFAPFCEMPVTYGQDAYSGVPTGGSPASEICPRINITQDILCQGQLPVTNVLFTGPADATIDSNGCEPTVNPALFTCKDSGVISISADCSEILPGDPSCPAEYRLDVNICRANGGPGACLTGYTYDPVSQCCSLQSGQGTSLNMPICPMGTYYLQGKNICVPYPGRGIVSITQPIGYAPCKP